MPASFILKAMDGKSASTCLVILYPPEIYFKKKPLQKCSGHVNKRTNEKLLYNQF